MGEGLDWCLALKGGYYRSRGPFWANFAIYVILGGVGGIEFSPNSTNTDMELYRHLNTSPNKHSSAWTEVSTSTCPPTATVTAPEGRDLGDFEFLGGLVASSSHHVSTNPEIKPYCHLTTYPNKDSSACTEVSVGTCPSRASIVAPGGRSWHLQD